MLTDGGGEAQCKLSELCNKLCSSECRFFMDSLKLEEELVARSFSL